MTSWDNAISVIIVVFFFPIEPQVMDTMGSSLMNPQFRASMCQSLARATVLRKFRNKAQGIMSRIHPGTWW
jgi:hypothetical protein